MDVVQFQYLGKGITLLLLVTEDGLKDAQGMGSLCQPLAEPLLESTPISCYAVEVFTSYAIFIIGEVS